MGLGVLASMLGDRSTYRRGNLRQSWRRFKGSPVTRREVWDQLRDYNRPDFHPDDNDTDVLVERWREELFGDVGILSDLLMNAPP
jgi:hypothetical protein